MSQLLRSSAGAFYVTRILAHSSDDGCSVSVRSLADYSSSSVARVDTGQGLVLDWCEALRPLCIARHIVSLRSKWKIRFVEVEILGEKLATLHRLCARFGCGGMPGD